MIALLTHQFGDRDTRQRAPERSLELATAADVIAFAGVDVADAIGAFRTGALDQRVSPGTPPPGRSLGWSRRLRGRTRRKPTRRGAS
ncbi:hypothetical protein GCM10023096_24950 [Nonomuraea ferruginea]